MNQPKKKLCKHSECKKMFSPWSSTQRTCSPLCERLHIVEKRVKREESAARKAELSAAAGTATEKEQVILQDRSKLEVQLEKTTHALVKLRDWGKPCISCNSQHAPDFEAGHYHSKGAHPELRFVLSNINTQCRHCNRHDPDHKSGYRQGISARYGAEKLAELVMMQNKGIRLSNWELSQLLRQRREQVAALRLELTELTPC